MKSFIYILFSLITSVAAYAQTSVPYTLAQKYFLRNDAQQSFDIEDGTMKYRDFMVLTSREELEKSFGYATVMGANGKPTNIDFTIQFVVALFVTAEEKITDLSVKSVEKDDKDLVITYEMETAEKVAMPSRAFKILIFDRKYGGGVKTIKNIKQKGTAKQPESNSSRVSIKPKQGDPYTYSKRDFTFISNYFTDLLKQEITSPAKTYKDRYWPVFNEPKPGSALDSLKAHQIYFTARNGWAEFTTLYAHFLKQMNGAEKYSKIRKQLYDLYEASLSIDINLGGNGTFTGDIYNALEAYVEYDISQKFTDSSKVAQNASAFAKQKAAYINGRSKQIQNFASKKYKVGEEPYNLKEQTKLAKANLAKLNTGIDNLSVLQVLKAFDTKFRPAE